MDTFDLIRALSLSEDALQPVLVDADGAPIDPASIVPRRYSDLTYDSRACTPGALFVCKGASFRPQFLDDARAHGASAYLAAEPLCGHGLGGVVVRDVRRGMARAACDFFGNPSQALDVVGITGTKGKTTVSFYLGAILRRAGVKPGLVGGVFNDVGEGRVRSHNTTPESIELQRLLAQARRCGCGALVMEVSSQALKYDRTLGVRFAVGVFTNIGEDHISPIEHPTLQDYFASKLRLFSQSEVAVVNRQTERAREVLDAAGSCGRVITYALDDARADVRLVGTSQAADGARVLDVQVPGARLSVPFGGVGSFNVGNALAAIAACEALGVSHEAYAALSHAQVPGRMERYASPDGSLVGIVDYAHNEMSLAALLDCARQEYPGREIWVVFGSVGMKATDRRAGLGRAATRADHIVLTEDEPGDVAVRTICDEIGAAVAACGRTYEIVEDRIEAIGHAVASCARPGVVVLAGKGPEDTMLRASGPEPYPTDTAVLRGLLGV